jgi:hypothetical protein
MPGQPDDQQELDTMRNMARGRLAPDPNVPKFILLLGTKRRRESRWLVMDRFSAKLIARWPVLSFSTRLVWFFDAGFWIVLLKFTSTCMQELTPPSRNYSTTLKKF